MNKSLVALSVASTLIVSGCMSTSEQTRFVGQANVQTASAEPSEHTNVMYEYEGVKGAVTKQSILHYPQKPVPAPEAKPKFTVVAAEDVTPGTIVTPLNTGGAQPSETVSADSLEYDADSVELPPAVAVGNVGETKPILDINEDISMQEYTLTPEDQIMSAMVDSLEYQHSPEVAGLRILKETSRVKVEVDEAAVKAYLINQYYNTNTNIEDDREELTRPESVIVFHGKQGTLNENIDALLRATKGINVVSDISDNHRFDFDFTVQGESVLRILDQLVEAFVTPYPVAAQLHKRNEVAHVYYKR